MMDLTFDKFDDQQIIDFIYKASYEYAKGDSENMTRLVAMMRAGAYAVDILERIKKIYKTMGIPTNEN